MEDNEDSQDVSSKGDDDDDTTEHEELAAGSTLSGATPR